MITELLSVAGAVLGAGAVVISSVIPAHMAVKAEERADEMDEHERARERDIAVLRVQQDSYEKAQATYDHIIAGLEREISRLNVQLSELRAQLAVEKETRAALTRKVVALESTAAELRATVDELRGNARRMRNLLEQHHITVPE